MSTQGRVITHSRFHPHGENHFLHQRAYTLQELMVTLTIAGILSTTGIGLFGFTSRHVMTSHINTLLTHLHLARSEAIKRAQPVVVCKSHSGSDCTPESSWSKGWMVYADTNENKRYDRNDVLIWVQQALAGNISLRFGETGKYHRVTYYPDGRAWPNATFTLCDKANPKNARAIILYWTGRPRTSTKNSRGGALQCLI